MPEANFNGVDKVALGASDITAVYLGADKIWPLTAAPELSIAHIARIFRYDEPMIKMDIAADEVLDFVDGGSAPLVTDDMSLQWTSMAMVDNSVVDFDASCLGQWTWASVPGSATQTYSWSPAKWTGPGGLAAGTVLHLRILDVTAFVPGSVYKEVGQFTIVGSNPVSPPPKPAPFVITKVKIAEIVIIGEPPIVEQIPYNADIQIQSGGHYQSILGGETDATSQALVVVDYGRSYPQNVYGDFSVVWDAKYPHSGSTWDKSGVHWTNPGTLPAGTILRVYAGVDEPSAVSVHGNLIAILKLV